jgi:predicted nucleic acid-binding protein
MSGKVFFDTSILIYAIAAGDARSAQAESLLVAGGNVSVQVLNEFVAVARRKLGMSWHEIAEAMDAVRALCEPPGSVTVNVHDAALRIAERYDYHIYDALILAAALDGDCDLLYSEDMQNGQTIASLTIRNPFVAA